jgi:hypothetical protein
MVVADQLLGQLVAGVPAPGPRVAGDRARLLEHDQVAVDRAHRQLPRPLGQLDDLQRPPRGVQRLDQGPPPGRVALLGATEPRRDLGVGCLAAHRPASLGPDRLMHGQVSSYADPWGSGS